MTLRPVAYNEALTQTSRNTVAQTYRNSQTKSNIPSSSIDPGICADQSGLQASLMFMMIEAHNLLFRCSCGEAQRTIIFQYHYVDHTLITWGHPISHNCPNKTCLNVLMSGALVTCCLCYGRAGGKTQGLFRSLDSLYLTLTQPLPTPHQALPAGGLPPLPASHVQFVK